MQTLTFDSDNPRQVVQFMIENDSIDEDQERFLAQLTLASPDTSSVRIQPNQTVILIDDNDGK